MHDCPTRCGDLLAAVHWSRAATSRLRQTAVGGAAIVAAAVVAVAAVTVVGCSPSSGPAPAMTGGPATEAAPLDSLVQFSLIAALADGDYSEGVSLREVLAGGDFGIGTFDRLEGEMIVLDGRMYQALADRTVRPADLAGSTPFAAVTFFTEDGRIENLAAATLEDLDSQLDRKLPRRNSPYALRIDGQFRELTLRSVPAQSPPFQPLVDVVKHQTTWHEQNVRGTLVGLHCPDWIGTLNVSGYHWHFLSDDRKIGGHVLDCDFAQGTLRYDECTSILIHVPTSRRFDSFDAETIQDDDIHKIERQRAKAE